MAPDLRPNPWDVSFDDCIAKAIRKFPEWEIVVLNNEETMNQGAVLGLRQMAIYLHVDDFGILGTSVWRCERVAAQIKMELQTSPLLVPVARSVLKSAGISLVPAGRCEFAPSH